MVEKLRRYEFGELRIHHLKNIIQLVEILERSDFEDVFQQDFSSLQLLAKGNNEVGEVLLDTYGRSSEEQQATLRKLIIGYKEFWGWATKNPKSKIRLSFATDWICDTCAIGDHCKRPLNRWDFYYDYSFSATLDKLASRPEYQNRITQREDESFEILVEVIFDPNFRKDMEEATIQWNT